MKRLSKRIYTGLKETFLGFQELYTAHTHPCGLA